MATPPRPNPDYLSNVPNLTDYSWNAGNSFYKYNVLGILHRGAENALRGIFPTEDYKGFSLNPNNLLDFDESNIHTSEMIAANTQAIIYSSFAALFAVAMIVLGVIWCIGRLCGTCSWITRKTVEPAAEYVHNRFGRSQKRQNSNGPGQPVMVKTKQRPNTLAFVMAAFIICFMGVYLTFFVGLTVTNSQLRSSINKLPSDLDSYLKDAETFVEVTKSQIDAILKTSYEDLKVEVKIIGNCGGGAATVQEMDDSMDSVLSELENGVMDIIQDFNYNNIPSALNSLILRKESLVRTLRILQEGQMTFLGTLCEDVETVGTELALRADAMNSALDTIPIEQSRNDLAAIELQFVIAGAGIFYSVTFLDLLLFLIFVAITGGTILLLIFPKNKWGSFTLNIGLFGVFGLGWLFWFFSIFLFFVSGIMLVVVPGAFQNVASDGTLVNPDARNGNLRVADTPIVGYTVPSVPHILMTCKNNEGAYTVFKLDQVFDVEQLDVLLDILVLDTPTPAQRNQDQDNAPNKIDIRELLLELQKINSNITANSIQKITSFFSELESKVELLDEQADQLEKQVSGYVDFAQEQIEKYVGTCTPLYNALDATVYTFSYKLGSPIGAYWLALTVMLFVLFPTVLAAVIFLRQ